MIRFFMLLFFSTILFGSEVKDFKWEEGVPYSVFLEKQNLPTKELLTNIDDDDKKLVEEIRAGVNCQMLRGADNKIEQVLIPLNDELQIHIYQDEESYSFEAIPIIYDLKTEAFSLKINANPSVDILNETGSIGIVSVFINAFKKSVNFTAIQKSDRLAMLYEQKYRLGRPFSMPTLNAAMVEINGERHFIYLNSDGVYYNEKGAQIESFLLVNPVANTRISSTFTLSRYHPILKKYRAHLGIDYAARTGTPIMAAGDGKVVFASTTNGYGNLIKIQHADGFMTLYAHQKSFRPGIKVGLKVSKNQVIGYVGSTGLSTGPHLHFGLYKDNQAIDPLKVVQVTTKKLSDKERNDFIKLRKKYDDTIISHIQNNTKFVKLNETGNSCFINNKTQEKVAASL
ncbi:MAG: peptidoglycan DD-metalloendopeptidase family protein [Campylobacterales bacterium]|nr:peptidoglycan DD-metalloendopeptidase family protein [Campylobacterales bacterium]